MNEERASKIPELRRYWIATTMAHQERYGPCADHENSLGAEANTVVFRVTVSDWQELVSALNARSPERARESYTEDTGRRK